MAHQYPVPRIYGPSSFKDRNGQAEAIDADRSGEAEALNEATESLGVEGSSSELGGAEVEKSCSSSETCQG